MADTNTTGAPTGLLAHWHPRAVEASRPIDPWQSAAFAAAVSARGAPPSLTASITVAGRG